MCKQERMELSGAFSNPQVRLETPRLAALKDKLLTRHPRRHEPAPNRRNLPRTTVPAAKTITRVLQQAEEPMSVQRIHVACEQLLGQPVVYGTVRDWLSDNAKTDKVARVKHGIYRLASPSQPRKD